jgi:hypothetical protein
MSIKAPRLFKRMYRMHPDDVWVILEKIDKHFAEASHLPRPRVDQVPTSLKLFATLRLLGGGSYLDIQNLYHIPQGSFFSIVGSVMQAINLVLDNISFPSQAMGDPTSPAVQRDKKRLAELAEGFALLSGDKFPGTIAAGDGLLLKILRPSLQVIS